MSCDGCARWAEVLGKDWQQSVTRIMDSGMVGPTVYQAWGHMNHHLLVDEVARSESEKGGEA